MEAKESYRWLENLRQSIALVGAPERCVHVGNRESDITSSIAPRRTLVPASSCGSDEQAGRAACRATPHDPTHRVFAQLAAVPWAGRHRITVDQDETTWLQVKFAAITTLPAGGQAEALQSASTPSKKSATRSRADRLDADDQLADRRSFRGG